MITRKIKNCNSIIRYELTYYKIIASLLKIGASLLKISATKFQDQIHLVSIKISDCNLVIGKRTIKDE